MGGVWVGLHTCVTGWTYITYWRVVQYKVVQYKRVCVAICAITTRVSVEKGYGFKEPTSALTRIS